MAATVRFLPQLQQTWTRWGGRLRLPPALCQQCGLDDIETPIGLTDSIDRFAPSNAVEAVVVVVIVTHAAVITKPPDLFEVDALGQRGDAFYLILDLTHRTRPSIRLGLLRRSTPGCCSCSTPGASACRLPSW